MDPMETAGQHTATAHADPGPTASPAYSPSRGERMMDQALEETFPASDAPYFVHPGSSMAVRNAASGYRARAADATRRAQRLLVAGAAVVFLAGLAATLISARKRG